MSIERKGIQQIAEDMGESLGQIFKQLGMHEVMKEEQHKTFIKIIKNIFFSRIMTWLMIHANYHLKGNDFKK